MYDHFTDAENTGAPLVPVVDEPTVLSDGGTPEDFDEAVLSHRLRE